jgi:hypothetical protein
MTSASSLNVQAHMPICSGKRRYDDDPRSWFEAYPEYSRCDRSLAGGSDESARLLPVTKHPVILKKYPPFQSEIIFVLSKICDADNWFYEGPGPEDTCLTYCGDIGKPDGKRRKQI